MRRHGHASGGGPLLVLAALAVGCAPAEVEPPGVFGWSPEEESPGLLTVDAAEVRVFGAEMDPCLKPMAVAVTPRLDGAALAREAEAEPGFGSRYVFTVEARMSVRDAGGVEVGADASSFTVSGEDLKSAEPKLHAGVVALGWDGSRWSEDGLVVSEAGDYDAEVRLTLSRVEVEGREIIARRELDSGLVLGTVRVRTPLELCRAWQAAATSLAAGPRRTVLVNGQATDVTPWIRWRRGLPSAVFGNLGERTGVATREQVVRQFLSAHPALFDIADASVIQSLETISEDQQVDGAHRLALRQAIDDGSVRRPIRGSRMVAVFDPGDRLLYLAGTFHPRLPATLAPETVTPAQAVAAVTADLAARGLETARQIDLLERIAFPTEAGLFLTAYLIGVDGVRDQLGVFEYAVSAADGSILERAPLASRAAATVTVWDMDPALIEDNDGLVVSGSDVPATRSAVIRVDSQQPRRLEDNEDNWPTSLGVISETFFETPTQSVKMNWNNFAFDRIPDSSDPSRRAIPANLDELRRAFTTVQQIQDFWEDYAKRWANNTNRIDLHMLYVDRDPQTPPFVGQYQPRVFHDAEVRMDRYSYLPQNWIVLYAPVHEIFHHLDREKVELKAGCWEGEPCAPEDDHRMPFAIKEGVPEIAMELADPYEVSNEVTAATGLLICIWLRKPERQACFDRAIHNFRKKATLVTRPADMEGMLATWPDCRGNPDANCYRVAPPPLASTVPLPDNDPTTVDPGPTTLGTYSFIPQVLLDLWETSATAISALHSPQEAEAIAAQFGDFVIRGFLHLDPEASFHDFRDALKVAILLRALPYYSDLAPIVDDVFARHGIDPALDAFCQANEDICH